MIFKDMKDNFQKNIIETKENNKKPIKITKMKNKTSHNKS